MKKITRYTVIEGDGIEDLENKVEAYIIRGGWQPQGGVVVKGNKYIQAMIFKKETK